MSALSTGYLCDGEGDAEIAKLPAGLDRAILVARSQEAYDTLIDPFR